MRNRFGKDEQDRNLLYDYSSVLYSKYILIVNTFSIIIPYIYYSVYYIHVN